MIRPNNVIRAAWLVVLALLAFFSTANAFDLVRKKAAESESHTTTLVQTIDTSQWSPPSPDTSGIVYLPNSNSFLVGDSEINEMALYAGVNMWHIARSGAVVSTWNSLAFSDEPVGLALNPLNKHLFVGDDTGVRGIYEVDPGADGVYGNSDDVVTFFRTGTSSGSLGFGSLDPEGLEYASDLGVLFVADSTSNHVYQVSPGVNDSFDGVPPAGDDQVTDFDTAALGLTGPEGIAYNPSTGNLFLIGSNDDLLFEVTVEGTLVKIHDIAYLDAKGLADLTFAPGSQNSSATNLYIVASGIDNSSSQDELPNDGRIYELALMPVATDDSAVTDEDTPVTIDVADNDTDVEGNLIRASTGNTCVTCTEPRYGILTDNGDGTFVYTPNSDFNGSDDFVYRMCLSPITCDSAKVTITVTAVNDEPVANDDSAVTNQGIPVTINVAENDADVDDNLNLGSTNNTCEASPLGSDNAASCSSAAYGTLINNGDGSFVYTPIPAFGGVDSFVYQICDDFTACDTATVSITVNGTNNLHLPFMKR